MTEPEASTESTPASDAHPDLASDIETIVRDLYYKRLAGSLTPYDDVVRRVLEACLRRGLLSGEASPEERDLAAELGISVSGQTD